MAGPSPVPHLVMAAFLACSSAAGAQPPSDAERRYMEAFRCARFVSDANEQVRDIVTYSGDSLLIKTKTGKTIELKSFFSEDEVDKIVLHCIKDFFPEEGLLFVDFNLYEDAGFSVVNLNTGDVTHHDGLYRLSPDRKRLLYENVQQYELHAIQVFKLTPCGLIEEYFALQDNALRKTDFSWTDDTTIEMTYHPDTDQEPQDKRMGRIYKGPDSWRMETSDLYRKVRSAPYSP